MKITVKFFSSLMEYLPASAEGNTLELQEKPGVTPIDILDRYKIPYEEAQTLMLNGTFLPQEDHKNALKEGDVLTIWPSIQGG